MGERTEETQGMNALNDYTAVSGMTTSRPTALVLGIHDDRLVSISDHLICWLDRVDVAITEYDRILRLW